MLVLKFKCSFNTNILFSYLSASKTTRLKIVEFQETWLIIRKAFVIVKLLWSVYTCLTQLYDGTEMYRIYYMFRHFTLAIFRFRSEKT